MAITMTVEQVIAELSLFPKDTLVFVAEPTGDYWDTIERQSFEILTGTGPDGTRELVITMTDVHGKYGDDGVTAERPDDDTDDEGYVDLADFTPIRGE